LNYDYLNRLTSKCYSGAPATTAVTYTYDGSNNFRSEPFTSLPPGWTSGGSITYSSNGAHLVGASNSSNYLALTEYLGEGMVAEFSFQQASANSRSVIFVNSGTSGQANYRCWGLLIQNNAIYRESCVGTNPCEDAYLMSLTNGVWYLGQLTIDNLERFVAKVWPVSNPSAAVQNTAAHTDWSGMAWKFKVFAITNSLDLIDYTQKQAFGVGRRTGMTDSSGSAAWSYDKRGRIPQENKIVGTSDKFTTQWAYNKTKIVKIITL
jgi:hypothetical protein